VFRLAVAGDSLLSSRSAVRLTMDDDRLDHELTLVRIAENQSTFRAANERIEAGAERARFFGAVPFICECPRLRCTEIVRMAFEAYEDIRANPVRFFTVPGHQDIAQAAGAALVVEERDGYVLLDKVGVAGEVARARYDSLAEEGSMNAESESRRESDGSDP
jgi:hypothetical protein